MKSLQSLKEAFQTAAAAHLIVDIQHDYCDPDSALAIQYDGIDLSQHHEAALRIANFVPKTRRCLKPVWIVHAIKFRGIDCQTAKYHDPQDFCRKNLYRQKPRASDAMIVKSGLDGFNGTDLEKKLKDRGVTTVLISGVLLNFCVAKTAAAAVARGFKVFIIEDQVANVEMSREEAQTYIDKNGWGRVTSEDLVKLARTTIRAPRA